MPQQFVKPSFVDLAIGPQTVRPLAVLVKQADFAHTVMTCVVDTRGLPYSGREEGLPVQLRWGHFPGNSRSYYGYVHHTEPYYDDRSNNTVKLVCLSASTALSQPLQKNWANVTADSVAREVIESAFLSVDTEPHSTVWPVLTAASGTAWEFLSALADKIGYRLCPAGTEVRFVSLAKLYGAGYEKAQRLSMGTELTRFRLAQDEAGGLAAQRSVYGLGQRDGRLFTVNDAGAVATTRLGTEMPAATLTPPAHAVVDTPHEGAAQLAGTAAAERFTYAAKAEVLGSALYVPGELVYLTGLEATQCGHWYVAGAEHDLDLRSGDYTSYLALRRDALGALDAAPQPWVVRPRQRQTPTGEVVSGEPPATLINGQWRSSWARRAV